MITALWCLFGALIAGKEWQEATAVIFMMAPAVIIVIIGCIQLFSIIFGGPADNFIYGLLSILLSGLVMLFGILLEED